MSGDLELHPPEKGASFQLSFVETLLSSSSKIPVLCQYDSPYNDAENQCTWFSVLCAKERETLLATLSNERQFQLLYGQQIKQIHLSELAGV